MSNKANTPPQSTLLLRVLGGGYLVYLAWDLRGSVAQGPLYLAAVLLFGLVGAVLMATTLWGLARHDYFRKTPLKPTEDCEEKSDE